MAGKSDESCMASDEWCATSQELFAWGRLIKMLRALASIDESGYTELSNRCH